MSISRIIRPKETAELLGISIPTLYRLIDEPEFPPRVRVGPNAVGFREDDLKEYIERNTETREPIQEEI